MTRQPDIFDDMDAGRPADAYGPAEPPRPREGYEDTFRSLLEAAPDAIVIADADGRIIMINRQTELMFGYERDALLGQPVELLLPARLQTRHVRHRGGYIQAPRTRPMGGDIELTARHRAGAEFPVEISLSPLQTSAGLLINTIIRDISARRRAEDERQQLLAQTQAALAMAEAAQRRLAFLAAASELLVGASLDEAGAVSRVARLAVPQLADRCTVDLLEPGGTPHRLADIADDPGAPELPELLRDALATGQPQLRARPSSALVLPLSAHGAPLGLLGLFAAQPERYDPGDIALAEDLAHRIAQAIASARLYQEAQSVLRVRERFLSIASHELRSPLAGLIGGARMLHQRAARDGALTERDQRVLQMMVEHAEHMQILIGDLLDFSRIETGQLTLDRRPLDLGALARQVVEELALSLDRHTIALDVAPAPLLVAGDWLRLEQVLSNLIHNAVKYSPQGGPVAVTVARSGARICLSVADQGIGIPEHDLPQLFQPFYRATNARSGRIGGSGLGLYVVREIVALHAGEVSVESREGRGSRFSVCLPAWEPREP